MPWTDPAPAVELHGTAPLAVTSTATVLLPGGRALRSFGLDDGVLRHALGADPAWEPLLAPLPCADPGPALGFLESGGGWLLPYRFRLEPAARAGGPPLRGTCVPGRRAPAPAWLRTYAWDPGPVAHDRVAPVQTTYKDPSVVQLPDGSWLMVVARVRRLADARGPGGPGGAPPDGPLAPGQSLSDIVAFHAPDLDFAAVRGPYPLVDGARALPGPPVRRWLGVPGAVVHDGWLDVYYVAEADRGPDGRPYLDAPAPDALLQGWRPGVALTRFPLDALAAALAAPPPPPTAPETPPRGQALGFVRLWEPGAAEGTVRPHRALLAGTRPVDPAPVRCDDGDVALFFSAIGGPAPLGAPEGEAPRPLPGSLGAWRGASIPAGAQVCVEGGGCFPVLDGIDFVADPARDLLASSGPDGLWLDPDPVRLPSGAWRVFLGRAAGPEALGPAARVDGHARDVCGE